MTPFDADIRKYLVGKYQGTESKSIREILTQLKQDDPELASQLIRGILQGMGARSDYRENEVAGAKREQMERDGIMFTTGVNPGIPAHAKSLADFRPRKGFPSTTEALEAVKTWVSSRGSQPGMLVLCGRPGVGKTMLAVGAACQLAQQMAPVIYRVESMMIPELHQAMKTGNRDKIFDELLVVPWLILDEFWGYAMSEWDRSEMDRLINVRWNNAGPVRTLITTNVSGDQLPPRIASRLGDATLSKVIIIDAPDYRRSPA